MVVAESVVGDQRMVPVVVKRRNRKEVQISNKGQGSEFKKGIKKGNTKEVTVFSACGSSTELSMHLRAGQPGTVHL